MIFVGGYAKRLGIVFVSSEKKTCEAVPVADIFSKKKRSEIMSHIKSRRTSIEETVALLLRRSDIKYRRNVNNLPGKPDFVISGKRIALFVHGCFWHGHEGCRRGKLPKSRRKYWKDKIERNQKRDRRAARLLRKMGWHVMTIWQCKLKNPGRVMKRVKTMIRKNSGVA